MGLQFTKAKKQQAWLRLAISAVSGGGKTMTALRLATGIAGEIDTRIAAIDTERGSMSKYSDRFDFDVMELTKTNVESYVEAIEAAGTAGYKVLIVDSLTHAWKALLEAMDQLARSKYKGNTWSAWSEGTPLQHRLINAILDYPGHIICTMRSKVEWITEKNHKGKMAPVAIGTQAEQGKGIEYEFDILMNICQDHFATITKDRTGKYQDAIIEKPAESMGVDLVKWLSDGVAATPTTRCAASGFQGSDGQCSGHRYGDVWQ